MKRKADHHRHVAHRVTHHHHQVGASSKTNQDYLVIVRGWMFIVLFAVMLGIGAMVGNFINQQLNSTPTVAGAQISR